MATIPPERTQTILLTQCVSGESYASNLSMMHMLSRDRQPFRCGVCSVSFSVNTDLVVHVQAHFVNKPYQCGYCTVSYEANPELLSHVKTHKLFLCLPSDSLPVSSHTDTVGQGKDTEVCGHHGPGMTTHTQGEDKGGETETHTTCTVLKGRTLSNNYEKSADNVSLSSCAELIQERDYVAADDQLKEDDSDQPPPDALKLVPVSVKKEIIEDHDPCEITGRNSGLPQSVCPTESHHHLTANQGDNSEPTGFLASSVSQETSPVCRCGECDAVVPSIMALTHHWDSCHSACTVCSERFPDPLHLQRHLKSAHGEDKGRKYRPFLCGLCGADFMVAKYVQTHIKDVHNSRADGINAKEYDCPVCPEQFESKAQVMSHIHSMHKADGRLQCPDCEKTYKHLAHLKDHYKAFHVHPDWRPHECPQCDKTFKRLTHLKNHMQSMHQGERPHQCSACDNSFKTRSGLRQHVRKSSHSLLISVTDTSVSCDGDDSDDYMGDHGDGKDYIGDHGDGDKHSHTDNELKEGDSDQPTPVALVSVKTEIHEDHHSCETTVRESGLPQSVCPTGSNQLKEGDFEQPPPDALKLVLVSVKKEIIEDHDSYEITGRNSGLPQSVCPTESPHHLTANQGENSEPADFLASSVSQETSPVCRCGECDAVVPSILALTHHWDSCHSACTVCSERFSDPLHLQLHRKLAHGEDKGRKYRPFLCGLCGTGFMVAKYLPPHIKDVHKVQLNASNSRSDSIKVFDCPVCLEQFESKPQVMAHIHSIHRADGSFQCPVCQKAYKQLANLKYHYKTCHVQPDWRPHQCPECGKTFKRPIHLKSHMQSMHGGERHHQCSACGNSFKTRSGLRQHVQISGHSLLKSVTDTSDIDNNYVSDDGDVYMSHDGDDNMDDDDKHIHTDDLLKEDDSDQPTPVALVSVKTEIHEDGHVRESGLPQSVCPTGSPHKLTANEGKHSEPTNFLASSASVNSEDINLQCHFLQVSDRPVKYQRPEFSSGSHSQQGDVRKVEPLSPQNIEQGCSESQAETSPVCRCGECDAVFPSILALTHHWDSCHSACTVCSERFSDPLHLQLHLKSAHGEDKGRKYRPFLCGLCGADFMVAKYLPPHIRDVHKVQLNASNSRPDSIKVFDCPVCPEQFESKPQVMAHVHSKHRADGRFQCPVCECEKTYKHLTHLKYHYKTCHVHPEECGKMLKQPTHLKSHIQSTHQGERPHQCSTCGNSFKTRFDLRKHVDNSGHSLLKSGTDTSADDDYDGDVYMSDDGDDYMADDGDDNMGDHDKHSHTDDQLKEGDSDQPTPVALVSVKTDIHEDHHLCQVTVRESGLPGSVCPTGSPHKLTVNQGDNSEPTDFLASSVSQETSPVCRCGECDAVFPSILALTHHWDSCHSACTVCSEKFPDPLHLQRHLKSAHGEDKGRKYRPFLCGLCGADFMEAKYIPPHIKYFHNSRSDSTKVFDCPICPEQFESKPQVTAHVHYKHRADGRFQCPVCQKTYKHWTHLKYHYKECHLNPDWRPHQCSQCNKTFKRPTHLKNHMLSHQGEKPHKCSACGSLFKYGYGLRRHVLFACQSHLKSGTDASAVSGEGKATGDQTQKRSAAHRKRKEKQKAKRNCNICGKTVPAIQLQSHLAMMHSDEKPYKCSLCDRAYKTKHMLEVHTRTHTKEKPFMCEICGRSFALKNTLAGHRNTHSNARPYRCEVCDKGFNFYSAMRLHLRGHRGDKRYSCDLCGKKFLASNALQRHALTHTDQRPWSCDKCGKTYRSTSSLRYHKANCHNMN